MFQNRANAGEKIARKLLSLDLRKPFVLAIPRGGVPVAAVVARVLACPLDVIPLVKISIPWSPDASYGAVAADGTMALNMPLIHRLELSEREIEVTARNVMKEARRREECYRSNRPLPVLNDRSVIIVDDGVGSGYSMLAAARVAAKQKVHCIIAACPVASEIACRMLSGAFEISQVLVLVRDQEALFTLSSYYKEFLPVRDEDIIRCLSRCEAY